MIYEEMKTFEYFCKFEITIGINPGYFHNNPNDDAAKIVSHLWQTYCNELYKEKKKVVSAVIYNVNIVYPTDLGCHEGGEKCAKIEVQFNPKFLKDKFEYIELMAEMYNIIEFMQSDLQQSTVSITSIPIDKFVYNKLQKDTGEVDTEFFNNKFLSYLKTALMEELSDIDMEDDEDE